MSLSHQHWGNFIYSCVMMGQNRGESGQHLGEPGEAASKALFFQGLPVVANPSFLGCNSVQCKMEREALEGAVGCLGNVLEEELRLT